MLQDTRKRVEALERVEKLRADPPPFEVTCANEDGTEDLIFRGTVTRGKAHAETFLEGDHTK